MYKHLLIALPNRRQVYVDLITSPAGHYLSRQPYVINLIKEVLAPMRLRQPEVTIEHDMGRVIGNTNIVETSEKDAIIYAQPHKKKTYARYAKNRSLSPSQILTIILEQDEAGNYELLDTWIGPYTPPFPGEDKATQTSKTYWESHALVMDNLMVQTKTITKDSPY